MKHLYILTLALFLLACIPTPAQQTQTAAAVTVEAKPATQTPKPTEINGVFQTATSAGTIAPTLTALASLTSYDDTKICTWAANDVVNVRVFPESRFVVVMTLERDSTVRLTGNFVSQFWDTHFYAEANRVNGLVINPPLWVEWMENRPEPEVDRPLLFPSDDCQKLPPSPSPEAGGTTETWRVTASVLNVRPTPDTSHARIRYLTAGEMIEVLPEVITSTDGIEWRKLATEAGYIAVRTSGGTVFAVKVG